MENGPYFPPKNRPFFIFVYNFCHKKSVGTSFCYQDLFIGLRYPQKRADRFWPKVVHKKWKMHYVAVGGRDPHFWGQKAGKLVHY